jgi:hypothetical protein
VLYLHYKEFFILMSVSPVRHVFSICSCNTLDGAYPLASFTVAGAFERARAGIAVKRTGASLIYLDCFERILFCSSPPPTIVLQGFAEALSIANTFTFSNSISILRKNSDCQSLSTFVGHWLRKNLSVISTARGIRVRGLEAIARN